MFFSVDFMPLLLFCIGFGKDIVTGTYKTININCYKRLDEHAMLLNTSVLNLDNGSEQRQIGVFPVSNMEISNEQTSAFANGSVFWLTQRYHKSSSKTPIKLVALDLHTENFSRVSWPSWYDEQHSHKMRLWSLKYRLCLSNVLQYPDVDVWSLKMEDSIEKWEKIFSINVTSIGRLATKFWMIGLEAAKFRPKEGKIDVDQIPFHSSTTALYTDTLIKFNSI